MRKWTVIATDTEALSHGGPSERLSGTHFRICSPRGTGAGLFSLLFPALTEYVSLLGETLNFWHLRPVVLLSWAHACCQRTPSGREGRDRKLWLCTRAIAGNSGVGRGDMIWAHSNNVWKTWLTFRSAYHGTRHCSKHFTHINSLNPHNSVR